MIRSIGYSQRNFRYFRMFNKLGALTITGQLLKMSIPHCASTADEAQEKPKIKKGGRYVKANRVAIFNRLW